MEERVEVLVRKQRADCSVSVMLIKHQSFSLYRYGQNVNCLLQHSH